MRSTHSRATAGTGRGNDRGEADTIGYNLNAGGAGAVSIQPQLRRSKLDSVRRSSNLGMAATLNDKFNIIGTEFENTAQDGFLNAPNIDDELNAH